MSKSGLEPGKFYKKWQLESRTRIPHYFNQDYSVNLLETGIIHILLKSTATKLLKSAPSSCQQNLSVTGFQTASPSQQFMSLNTASQNQLLNLAQQGDVASLTTLINQNLFPLGVTVMTIRRDNCLVVSAVLPPHIDRLFLINFMREGMERLQAKSIKKVLLIGKDREKIAPDWQYVLNLHQADLPPIRLLRQRPLIPKPSTPAVSQSSHQQHSIHILASRPVCWLLLLATCGLLGAGTWAAKTVFLVENMPENHSTPVTHP